MELEIAVLSVMVMALTVAVIWLAAERRSAINTYDACVDVANKNLNQLSSDGFLRSEAKELTGELKLDVSRLRAAITELQFIGDGESVTLADLSARVRKIERAIGNAAIKVKAPRKKPVKRKAKA